MAVSKRKLQVFISSTYTDLKEERQAAVAAILKAGHIPAGMELFTAGDQSQMKTIERWIDESDVYMLILGGRYGSVEPISGSSYTELEYDYAISRGKPNFAVVITDDALETKKKIDNGNFVESDNPEKLEQFRGKVLRNISSFFSDSKDVKLCVHESMSDYAANRNLKGWISASDIPDLKTFQDEINKLREENAQLAEKNKKLEDVVSAQAKKNNVEGENDELFKVLQAIKVKIPATLTSGTADAEIDLFSCAYNNRDTLINGVTNAINASEAENFFFWQVIPKLQAHGLADNEKVPGVRYRRGFLNRKGQNFFAEFEKKMLLAAAKRTEEAEKAPQQKSVSQASETQKQEKFETGPQPDAKAPKAKKSRRRRRSD